MLRLKSIGSLLKDDYLEGKIEEERKKIQEDMLTGNIQEDMFTDSGGNGRTVRPM